MRFYIAFAGCLLVAAALAFPQPQNGVVHLKVARAALTTLARRSATDTVQVTLENGESAYLANITLGTPGQDFTVLLDTGSSDLWVPRVNNPVCLSQSSGPCLFGSFDSSTSKTFQEVQAGGFNISYVTGQANGDYVSDTLVIGGVTLDSFIFGLATSSSTPLPIMGIGYANAEADVVNGNGKAYNNLPEALVKAGLINTVAYSLWLDNLEANTGNILFGAIDTTKYTSPLVSIDVYTEGHLNYPISFLVAATSLSFTNSGGTYIFQTDTFGTILDSGTSLTVLPDSLFGQVLDYFGNDAYWDDSLQSFVIPCKYADAGGYFSFGFAGSGGPVINVNIAEFILSLPPSDAVFVGDVEYCILGFDFASNVGLDARSPVIFGDTFLRSAYVVYDLANNKIGIANAKFNVQSSNIITFSSLSAPIPSASVVAASLSISQTHTAVMMTSSLASVSVPMGIGLGRLSTGVSSVSQETSTQATTQTSTESTTQPATSSATSSATASPRNGGARLRPWTMSIVVGLMGIWGLMFIGGIFAVWL